MGPNHLPQNADKERYVREMFDRISPRYDLANRILTFGLDQIWRRQVVTGLGLRKGQRVLDVACGTGDFLTMLSSAGLIPVGVDFSFGMLEHSHSPAPKVQGSALELPFATESFDGLTCGFALRNFSSLQPVFAEFRRVLKPGGRLGILEVSTPSNPVFKFGHNIYFNKLVPRLGGVISDRSAYRYLPESVAYLPTSAGLRGMLAGEGFEAIDLRLTGLGAAQTILCTRKGAR